MDFEQLSKVRQSCRSFDPSRDVEEEKLMKCVEAAKNAPSAVNAQPYDIWVVRKPENVRKLLEARLDFNRFIDDCGTFVVFTDAPYAASRLAEQDGRLYIDYRTQDVGECIAYFTLQASDLGLDTCILGGFDMERLQQALGTDAHIQIIIAVGYAKEGYKTRAKSRKPTEENVRFL